MVNQIVPNTDNPTVALIAAALYFSDETAAEDATLEDRLNRYRRAYETLVALVRANAEVVAILPQLHSAGASPTEPIGPSYGVVQ